MKEKDPFGDLDLEAAEVVDEVPKTAKGSKIEALPEFRDALRIIAKVKEVGQAPARTWKIFDKEKAIKRTPAVRNFKALVAAFAAKLREEIEKQGVGKQVKLQQRRDTFFIVGAGASKGGN